MTFCHTPVTLCRNKSKKKSYKKFYAARALKLLKILADIHNKLIHSFALTCLIIYSKNDDIRPATENDQKTTKNSVRSPHHEVDRASADRVSAMLAATLS